MNKNSIIKFIKSGKFLDLPDLITKLKKDGQKVFCFIEDCDWLKNRREGGHAERDMHCGCSKWEIHITGDVHFAEHYEELQAATSCPGELGQRGR